MCSLEVVQRPKWEASAPCFDTRRLANNGESVRISDIGLYSVPTSNGMPFCEKILRGYM